MTTTKRADKNTADLLIIDKMSKCQTAENDSCFSRQLQIKTQVNHRKTASLSQWPILQIPLAKYFLYFHDSHAALLLVVFFLLETFYNNNANILYF